LVTNLPARIPPRPRVVDRRPARVARVLALAHHIQAGVTTGRWKNASEVSRALGLSRNRLSQVLALLNLAPDLQERVLFLEAVDGDEPVTEKALFVKVARLPSWSAQRSEYRRLLDASSTRRDVPSQRG
jgi:hypothetical protein